MKLQKKYKMKIVICEKSKNTLLIFIVSVLVLSPTTLSDGLELDACGSVVLRCLNLSNEYIVIQMETPIGSTALKNIFPETKGFQNSSESIYDARAAFSLRDSCTIKLCNHAEFSETCTNYSNSETLIKISEGAIFHCACPFYPNKGENINFDKDTVGVVFQPYTGRWDRLWSNYSFAEVKTMLRVTSTKFSFISTYGIGSAGANITWADGDASGFVPVAAAQINKESNELRLKVLTAIWQNNEDVFQNEIRNAFTASKEANKIFPNTVWGIIFTSNNVDTVAHGEYVKMQVEKHRQEAHASGIKIGVRVDNCGILLPPRLVESDNTLYLAPNSQNSTNIFPKGSLEEILFNISRSIDFIICHRQPQPIEISTNISQVTKRVGDGHFLALKNWFAHNAPNLTFFGQTGWPSQGFSNNYSPNTLRNQRDYWYYMNQFSMRNKIKIFMFESIDEPYKSNPNSRDELDPNGFNGSEAHYGWWKRIDGNNSISYVEKYIEIPEDILESSGLPVITFILPIAAIVILLLAAGVYLYKRQRYVQSPYFVRLSNEEATIFREGMPEDTKEDDSDYLIALRFPYDKSHEIAKNKFFYDKANVIGKGSSGIVYKGTIEGIKDEIAFKTTGPSSTITHVRSLLSEIKLLSYIGQHDNIVKFIGAHTEKIQFGEVYLAIEYCSLGSIEDILRLRKYGYISGQPEDSPLNNNAKVVTNYVSLSTVVYDQPEKEVATLHFTDLVKWCHQISDAMDFISNKKIVHADLACRNILLTSDQTAKLTDFGLSRKLYKYAAYLRFNDEEPLPWRWMAPESLKRLIFSTQSDIWSFGVTLWEIFSLGEVPYPGLAWSHNFANALELGFRLPTPPHATPEIYNHMVLCWNADPHLRIQFWKLKEFFKYLSESSAKGADEIHC